MSKEETGKASIDKQSRKWQLTINNPLEKGLSHENIKEILWQLTSVKYYCISDEKASIYHTHIYIYSNSPIRFTTLKRKFPTAHIELARGTSEENRNYVFKEGKWEKDKKRGTNIVETHEECGEMPVERPGARNDLADLYDMIKQGASDYEILDSSPEFFNQIERMSKVRQTIMEEKYKDTFRKMEVTYIWGESGTGKTRGVMEKYGYENVYRVTNYNHPFDMYKGQEVLVFEEFRESLPLTDMLNYLDGYPLQLPCRYYDRVACFTKVYIITNVDLKKQYYDIQRREERSWKAFLRRIHYVVVYVNNERKEYTIDEYLQGYTPITKQDEIPFKEEQKNA